MTKKTKGMVKTVISLLLVAMLLCTGFLNIVATAETVNETSTSIVEDLEDNLILYSNFDNENANDVSGKGHHGSVVSNNYDNPTVEYVEGISGQAVHITGNTLGGVFAHKYISYGDSSEIIPATGDFTFSMFFKASADLNTAKSYTLLSNTTHVSSYKEVGFMLFAESNTSDISQYLTFGTGGSPVAVSVAQSNTLEAGNWYMMTVSFDRDGKMQLYINGAVVAEGDISSYSDVDINSRGGILALGANCVGKLPTTNSIIDEFRIYDKALSADEISELYEYSLDIPEIIDTPFDMNEDLLLYSSFDNENANDESGKGHNGQVIDKEGYKVEYVNGVSGKALHIGNQENAMQDHIATDETPLTASTYVNYGASEEILPNTGDFSFNMFFKASDGIGENTVLFSNKDYTAGKNLGFALIVDDSPNSTSQRMNVGTGINFNITNSSKPGAADGNWHMLTTTFDRDGYMIFYIDGVVIGSADISEYKDISINAGLPLILGADGDLGYGTHNSVVDELRIYDKALSADEINQLYTATAKYVAIEKDDTVNYYDTLDVALEEAVNGDVVKLLTDRIETNITVPTGVTLDLNGNTLTVDTLYAVADTAVVDTTNAEGRIVVNDSATLLDTDNAYGGYSYVAMKLDAEDDDNTYALVPMILQAKADVTSDSTMSVKIRPVVNIGDVTAKTNELFGNGAQDNGLQFAIRVTWTAEDETEGKQTLTFADTLIAEAYTAGKAMTLDMSGIPANTALDVDLVIVSALGAETVSNLYTKGGN